MAIIDWQKCVELSGGKPQLASKLLFMLADELPAVNKNIITLYQKKEFHKLDQELHKLLGACCYCSVPRLKKATEEAEKFLNQKSLVDLQISLDKISEEILAILQEIKHNSIYREAHNHE